MAITPSKRKFKIKHYINYMIIAAVLILFIVLDATTGLKTSTKDLLVKISYSVILAVSLNMVVGFLGELSLGHAGFMCVGAYIGCLCGNLISASLNSDILVFLISAIVGGLAAAVFGLIIGVPTLRLKGDYLAIATLAAGEIARTVIKNQAIFGKAIGLSTHTYNDRKNAIPFFVIALIIVLISVAIVQNLMKSRQGRAIQAIRDSEIAARATGVNVTYYKLAVFVISAFLAGVAGVMYGSLVTPVRDTTFGFNYSIEILVMVVLGGMGNVTGSILAASALTFINFKLTTQLSGDLAVLKNLVYALILIVIVVYNNAPALRGIRERFNLYNLGIKIKSKLFKPEEGGEEPPTNASWDKIPTKIPMDAILSTDMTRDDSFTPDAPEKEGK